MEWERPPIWVSFGRTALPRLLQWTPLWRLTYTPKPSDGRCSAERELAVAADLHVAADLRRLLPAVDFP